MFKSLQNNFLIAMPNQNGSFFERTVIYICQHDEQGAMGIIINYQLQKNLDNLLAQMQITNSNNINIYLGGPVQQEHGFILHDPTTQQWNSSIILSKDITLTTSSDILTAINNDSGPKNMIIALGYAGWGKGQLEQEILENAWMQADYSPEVMFEVTANQKWNTLLNKIGIQDPTKLSEFSGHA